MSGNGLISSIRRLINADSRRQLRQFEQLHQQMDDVLGDGGILKEVVQPGEGPPVPQNASVLIHYSGFLEYSDRPFETTTHLEYPEVMDLGRDWTLTGLELGLLTMKKGEFSRFLLQPQYAYGNMGLPPLVPSSATVLYEVHVLDFLDSRRAGDLIAMCPEERNTAPLSTVLEVVNTVRSFSNHFFKRRRYENAKERYRQGVTLLGNRKAQSDEEKEKINQALLPLYLNLSLTELRLDNPHKALDYAKKAYRVDSSSKKALFRCGQAYQQLQEYERAQNCFIIAKGETSFDSDINKLMRRGANVLQREPGQTEGLVLQNVWTLEEQVNMQK